MNKGQQAVFYWTQIHTDIEFFLPRSTLTRPPRPSAIGFAFRRLPCEQGEAGVVAGRRRPLQETRQEPVCECQNINI